MQDIKQQHYFKKIDKYYFSCRSNGYYNFNKIDYADTGNYCYYSTWSGYKFSRRLNNRYNNKSWRRLNKEYIQFLSYSRPIVLFNDIKKFKSGGGA